MHKKGPGGYWGLSAYVSATYSFTSFSICALAAVARRRT